MTTTLVLPESVAARLAALASLDVETGAVLLARKHTPPSGEMRLLGTHLLEVPESEYVHRHPASLLIRSSGYVPALAVAERAGAVPIWLHTHPGVGSSPEPSRYDQQVDAQLADLFRLRSGSEFYGSAIVSPRAGGLSFTGHLESGSASSTIDRLLVVGSRIRLCWNEQLRVPELPALYDRNVRAFGTEIQQVLQDLRVSVVGAGGTGSAVAEQLIRLGVRHLALVDADSLTESNLTRVYGSHASDVSRPKVDVLRDHLLGIAPSASVSTLRSMLTVESTARAVAGSDVIFGCTDDNAGRLVLSRLSAYMLQPVIDLGVLLTADRAGTLDGIHGRITVLTPGSACLVCRQRIDLARAQTELLTPAERIRRLDEGYATALPGVEPAVVAYTSMVASTAVAELLERLIGYGPEVVPSEILLRIHDREISTNVQSPRKGHYCDPAAGKLGSGPNDPFLEQTWSA